MSFRDVVTYLEAIYGPFGADDGVSKPELDAAEARLDVRLPSMLRELYLKTGNRKDLHRASDVLALPIQIGFIDDHLVFYTESQGSVVWGIARDRLGESDPPVDRGSLGAERAWSFEQAFGSISELVRLAAAHQAVQGGLPFVGVSDDALGVADVRARIGAPAFGARETHTWLVDGGVVLATGDGHLGLATRSADAFVAASTKLGLDVSDWDYATLQDDEP